MDSDFRGCEEIGGWVAGGVVNALQPKAIERKAPHPLVPAHAGIQFSNR